MRELTLVLNAERGWAFLRCGHRSLERLELEQEVHSLESASRIGRVGPFEETNIDSGNFKRLLILASSSRETEYLCPAAAAVAAGVNRRFMAVLDLTV